jgi:hypothetical protein
MTDFEQVTLEHDCATAAVVQSEPEGNGKMTGISPS